MSEVTGSPVESCGLKPKEKQWDYPRPMSLNIRPFPMRGSFTTFGQCCCFFHLESSCGRTQETKPPRVRKSRCPCNESAKPRGLWELALVYTDVRTSQWPRTTCLNSLALNSGKQQIAAKTWALDDSQRWREKLSVGEQWQDFWKWFPMYLRRQPLYQENLIPPRKDTEV